MINLKKSIILLFILFASVNSLKCEDIDSTLIKIDKSFNVYGAFFRSLINGYVIDLDPEFLMKEGIKGILSSLDPYTTIYESTDDQDYEILIDGSYVGFGITVGVIDSQLTMTEVMEGFPAKKAGLKIGDKLYKIDSTIVLNLNSQELRTYTNGKPGSKSKVEIIRPGVLDTLKFEIIREDIKLSSVSYSGMINDSIGIIKLETFSNRSYDEFRDAFQELNKKNKLKGLIIDLRNNPGGYLESAVKICEMFVPKGTLIVSTKDHNLNSLDYVSKNEPQDNNLPLAILINSSSASASEIVAGAMQDLDRAIIIGERSFGKGLVQTMVDLPYGKTMKITSAKYYIPSGRCIQRINYGIDGKYKIINDPDKDSTFFTKNKREVKELNGINPDIIIEEKMPDYITNLLANNIIFGFVNLYASEAKIINFNEELSDSAYNDFINYYKNELRNPKKMYFLKNDIQNALIAMNKVLGDSSIGIQAKKELALSRNILINEEISFNDNQKKMIKEKLMDEIVYRLNSFKEYTKYLFRKEESIKKANFYLIQNNYNKILSVKNDKI